MSMSGCCKRSFQISMTRRSWIQENSSCSRQPPGSSIPQAPEKVDDSPCAPAPAWRRQSPQTGHRSMKKAPHARLTDCCYTNAPGPALPAKQRPCQPGMNFTALHGFKAAHRQPFPGEARQDKERQDHESRAMSPDHEGAAVTGNR